MGHTNTSEKRKLMKKKTNINKQPSGNFPTYFSCENKTQTSGRLQATQVS